MARKQNQDEWSPGDEAAYLEFLKYSATWARSEAGLDPCEHGIPFTQECTLCLAAIEAMPMSAEDEAATAHLDRTIYTPPDIHEFPRLTAA